MSSLKLYLTKNGSLIWDIDPEDVPAESAWIESAYDDVEASLEYHWHAAYWWRVLADREATRRAGLSPAEMATEDAARASMRLIVSGMIARDVQ